MTDTAAREEAVERVRAYVEATAGYDADWMFGPLAKHPLTLGDLRLLLSGEPASPLIAEKMAYVAQLALGEAQASGKPLDEQVDLVLAALTDPRQPSEAEGWMPIESAPRDGTPILIHVGGAVPIVVYADPADDQQWRRFLGFGKSGYVGTIHTDNATHWRLLPAPPTGDQS